MKTRFKTFKELRDYVKETIDKGELCDDETTNFVVELEMHSKSECYFKGIEDANVKEDGK